MNFADLEIMFGYKIYNSIILATRREVIRGDFSRQANRLISKIRLDVDPESGIAESIALVLSGQRRLTGRTLVLLTDIWSQIIKLPVQSVQGLVAEELIEALKFEAETLSGIEIDDLSLAFVRLGIHDDQQYFWVSALRSSELQNAKRILENAGAKNILFAHPAGFSSVGNGEFDSRIEYWSDLVFQFGTDDLGPLRIAPLGNKSGLVIESQLSEKSPCSPAIMVGLNSAVPSDERPNATDLSQPEALDRWLASVARVSNIETRVPTIQLQKRTAGVVPRHLRAALTGLVVSGCCFWHWQHIVSRTTELRESIQRIEQPEREKKTYDAQLTAILETRTQAEAEAVETNDELLQIQFFVNSQNNRFSLLLKHLMDNRTNDLVIDEISETEEGVVISGVSLNGQSAQRFAKKLRQAGIELGWAVNPAKQKGQQKLTSGGPWDFDILLTDIGPFESDPNRFKLGLGGL